MATDRRSFLKFLGVGAAAAVVKPEILPLDRYEIEGDEWDSSYYESVQITPLGSEQGWMTAETCAGPLLVVGDFSKFYVKDRPGLELVRD